MLGGLGSDSPNKLLPNLGASIVVVITRRLSRLRCAPPVPRLCAHSFLSSSRTITTIGDPRTARTARTQAFYWSTVGASTLWQA